MTDNAAMRALQDQVEAHIRDLRQVRADLDKKANEIHHQGVMIRWASFGLAIVAVALSTVSGATGLSDVWSRTTIAVLSLVAALVVALNTAITATRKTALTRRYKMLGSALGYDARIEDLIDKSGDELRGIPLLPSPDDQEKRLQLLEHETDGALDLARDFVHELRTQSMLDDLEEREELVKR